MHPSAERFAREAVWAAAGTPEAVWPIDPEALVELADATVADVAGSGD